VVVSSLDPPDFRGEEVYRIEFTLLDKEEKTMDGFIHRLVDMQYRTIVDLQGRRTKGNN
jgi:hypothetical protein